MEPFASGDWGHFFHDMILFAFGSAWGYYVIPWTNRRLDRWMGKTS